MKRKSWLFILLAVALVVSGCAVSNKSGGGKSTYTIRFSHIHPAGGTSKALASELFKKEVEEKSGGRIKVEIYPNGELFGDQDGLQALQNGALEMLAPASGIMTAVAPEIGLLDLPYLLKSDQVLADITKPGSKTAKLFYENEKLASANIKVIGLWDYGFKHIWSNKAIRSVDDAKGQKLRIVGGSQVLKNQMEAWGANPTPMALGEIYNALQQGIIDGFDNGYSSVVSLKANEVLKSVTLTNHGYNAFLHIINKKFFESLPSDLQKVVQEAADAAAKYNVEIAFQKEEEARKKIEEAKTTEFIELTPEQLKQFEDKVIPSVWNQNAGSFGQEIIDELLSNR